MNRLVIILVFTLSGCSFAYDFEACQTKADCRFDHMCTADKLCRPLRTKACNTVLGEEFVQRGDDPLIIGVVTHLTGLGQPSGQSTKNAIELAIAHINDPRVGGVLGAHAGRPLVALVCDDTTNAEAVPAIMQHLDEVGVPAVIGSNYSSVTKVLAQEAQERRILAISPSSTAVGLSLDQDADDQNDDFFWRTAPSDAFQGQAIAHFAAKRLISRHPDREVSVAVALVYVNDTYGRSLMGATNGALGPFLMGSGLTVDVVEFPYEKGVTQTFETAVDYVLVDAPKTVILIGLDGSHSFFELLRQRWHDSGGSESSPGFDPFVDIDFFASDGVRSGRLPAEFTARDDWLSEKPPFFFGTAYAGRTGDTYDRFAADYISRYLEEGDVPEAWTEHAYDATILMAFALAGNPTPTGETMVDTLKRLGEANASTYSVTDTSGLKNLLTSATGDRNVTLEGTSGLLVFDVATGERQKGDIRRWDIDVEATTFVECGLVGSAESIRLEVVDEMWCAAICASDVADPAACMAAYLRDGVAPMCPGSCGACIGPDGTCFEEDAVWCGTYFGNWCGAN